MIQSKNLRGANFVPWRQAAPLPPLPKPGYNCMTITVCKNRFNMPFLSSVSYGNSPSMNICLNNTSNGWKNIYVNGRVSNCTWFSTWSGGAPKKPDQDPNMIPETGNCITIARSTVTGRILSISTGDTYDTNGRTAAQICLDYKGSSSRGVVWESFPRCPATTKCISSGRAT